MSAAGPGGTARQGAAGLLWSLVDQLSFAVAGFLFAVLLAQRLPADGYGAFATASTILFLAAIAHSAFVAEPMLVLGGRAAAPGGPPSEYCRALPIHWGSTVALVAAGSAALLALPGASRYDAGGLLAFAAALAGLLWSGIARRSAYLGLQMRSAAASSVAYAALVAVGLLAWPRPTSLAGAFAVMAVGAVLATAPLHVAALRRAGREATHGPPSTIRGTAARYARYGRWVFLAGLVAWLPLNLPILWLSASHTLGDAAQFRAALNLSLPCLQAVGAGAVYLLAALAAAAPARRPRVLLVGLLLTVGAGVAWLAFLLATGSFLGGLLYGGRYRLSWTLLLPIALLPLSEGLVYATGTAFRVALRPSRIIGPSLGGALVLLTALALARPSPVAAGWVSVVGSATTAALLLAALPFRHLAAASRPTQTPPGPPSP